MGLLQRRITTAVGGSSGETLERGRSESREAFLTNVFANFSTEGTVALIVDLNVGDEIVTEKFSVHSADGRCAMDLVRANRKEREQKQRDADSDFQFLD